MSSVVEIEKAVAALPAGERRRLIAKLARSTGKKPAPKVAIDPVMETIGAFSGPVGATGRQAEDILYGPAAGK
jgi:hypothetical protein